MLDPQRDRVLMEMLADLYCRINVAIEGAGYGKLPRPGVGGSPTASGNYILALQTVAEKLEVIVTKAQSAMDAEVRGGAPSPLRCYVGDPHGGEVVRPGVSVIVHPSGHPDDGGRIGLRRRVAVAG